jgi:hypothetical protein
MNLDKIRNLFTHLSARDLPTGGAALVGTILLLLLFRPGKFFIRLLLFLIAIGLFASAVWWHQHK